MRAWLRRWCEGCQHTPIITCGSARAWVPTTHPERRGVERANRTSSRDQADDVVNQRPSMRRQLTPTLCYAIAG